MTVLTLTANDAVHTGACLAVPRALIRVLDGVRGLRRPAPVPVPEREYCLHDGDGNPIGVIRSPNERPRVGPNAPAIYVRRPG